MRFCLVAACLTWLALSQEAPARENHALLIGASDYPALDQQYWLVGPANDVDLVRSYLLSDAPVPFEPGNITVLADGVEGGQDPTLAAIRAEMAALQDRLHPGDFVYLHFSGHGTQAPAQSPETELDGLDEMFLPSDIGPWNDTTGAVENALIDDEIGAMIDRLRDRGATVWAVFDSCHSGTITRAAPGVEEVRLRKLSPLALDVPQAALDAIEPVQTRALNPRAQSETPLDFARDIADGHGNFIAFYAAQSNEATPEKRLPRGKPGRRSQGVFTYTLFEALAANPDLSYRQLGQEVLRRYATGARARSTPMFVGDLDRQVFGSEMRERIRQWPLQAQEGEISIKAGQLHGLEIGTKLAVLASPADPDQAALAFVEVTKSDTFTADLALIAKDGTAALSARALPKGAYARQLAQELDFEITVAVPGHETNSEVLQQTLSDARDAALLPARLTIEPDSPQADLRLSLTEDASAIIVAPGALRLSDAPQSAPIRISTQNKDREELALVLSDTLARMARVQNLLKLGGSYAQSPLEVSVNLRARQDGAVTLTDMPAIPVPRLVPDDEVHILARNEEIFPVDLNVLYIGSDFSITHMFKGRLHPGDTLKQGLLRITDEAFGRDRVLLLLTPAETHDAVADFGFLAQEELPRLRGQASAFVRSLAEAGFGDTLRAATPLGASQESGPRPMMVQFDVDTLPRP